MLSRSSMLRRCGMGLLVLLVAGPLGAQAPPRELSVEDAIRIAVSRNPGFQAWRNDEDVANWDMRSSIADLFPSSEVTNLFQYQGGGETRLGSIRLEDLGIEGDLPAFYLSSFDAIVRMEISGPKLLAPFQSRAERTATRMRVENASQALTQSVVRHYLAVLRALDGERLAVQEAERAEENLRLAQVRNELGAAADWEVQRAQVTTGRAEVNLLQARNELRTARLRLAQQLGLPPDEELVLTSQFEIFEPVWEEEALYSLALDVSPELSSLEAEHQASRHGLTMARSRYLPSFWLEAFLSGFTRHTKDEERLLFEAEQMMLRSNQECQTTNAVYSGLTQPLPTLDCSHLQFTEAYRQGLLKGNRAFPFKYVLTPPMLTFGVSIPIFQGLTRKRDVAQARAEAEDARYRLEERRIGLRADLAAGLGAVRTAYQTARLEEMNREVANQQLRLARERYEMGSGSFLELVEAETVMASSEHARVDAVYSFHQAVVDLETLVGRPLREMGEGMR